MSTLKLTRICFRSDPGIPLAFPAKCSLQKCATDRKTLMMQLKPKLKLSHLQHQKHLQNKSKVAMSNKEEKRAGDGRALMMQQQLKISSNSQTQKEKFASDGRALMMQ